MKDARGFTLIEMVIVIMVIGVLAAAVAPMALSSLRAYNATLTSLNTLDKLRYATDRLARELREVNYDGTRYAFTPPDPMSTTAPSFTKADGVTVSVGNTPPTVTLNYSTLSVTPAPSLTDQVKANGLLFAYFDKNGISTTSASTVRYVEISLTLTQGSQDYSQRTRVALRNR